MNTNSFDEKVFDMVLLQVLDDLEREEIEKSEKLLQELQVEDSGIEITPQFDKMMRKLIKDFEKENSVTKQPRIRTRLIIAVAIITMLCALCSAGFADFNLIEWFRSITNTSTNLSMGNHVNYAEYAEIIVGAGCRVNNLPSEIPTSYSLSDIKQSVSGTGLHVFFSDYETNDELIVRIKETGGAADITLDSQDGDTEAIKVRGYRGIATKNRNVNTITVHAKSYTYIFESTKLTTNELIDVAGSIVTFK